MRITPAGVYNIGNMHTTGVVFATSQRIQVLNITPKVAEVVARSGIAEGMCIVNSQHTTMGIAIQEDEPLLIRDMERWLEGR